MCCSFTSRVAEGVKHLGPTLQSPDTTRESLRVRKASPKPAQRMWIIVDDIAWEYVAERINVGLANIERL